MTSIRSYFNKAIIRQDLKQYGWIGILYLLALLFFIPFLMLFEVREGQPVQQLNSLYDIANGISLVLLLIFPVLAGTFIFRYLHAKAPSDLYHGLPITRSQLLTSHLCSALVLITVPVWITAILTALIRPYADYYVYDLTMVWEFGIIYTILGLFVCAFTILMAICFGQTLIQMVITYGLLFTPAWLMVLGIAHIRQFLFGFHDNYFENGYSNLFTLEKVTPLLRIAGASREPFGWFELTMYLVLAFFFLGVGYFLYRKRDGAAASQTIVYRFLTPLFIILVMLFCSLVGGIYMSGMRDNSRIMMMIGYILGGGLGYLVVQMVLHRTWLVFSRKVLVHGVIYMITLAAILYVPVSGIGGYESRVPEQADVKSVLYSDSDFSFANQYDDYGQRKNINLSSYFTEDEEYTAAVIKLHQTLVSKYKEGELTENEEYTSDTIDVTIGYELKNGHRVIRKYRVTASEFEGSLKPIMESAYYKELTYKIKELNEDPTSRIILDGPYGGGRIEITDANEIKELKALYIQELMNASYEDQRKARNQMAWSYIEFYNVGNRNNNYYGSWNKSFTELGAWLEEKGYADQIRMTPADITSMTITRNVANTGFVVDLNAENPTLDYYQFMAKLAGETRVMKEEDKENIILNQKDFNVYGEYNEENNPYLVKVTLNDGESVIWSLEDFPEGLQ
ncbi:hypothetical protein J45TS6_24230 [Paenibacillus sp. J45TS6]|uniref:DUF6449 domain-containing protein n=1 Tax=Paenibacillus sp. J45TS6 TaxID=2807196 RepID=UPI001B261953|nr:DUF6449 domain-containing protein [Paenibacillus sp. J45TS6]GIP43964.1 hypothetical protein J45TS6_24230 [Paenibacillus sp. J45TS6]